MLLVVLCLSLASGSVVVGAGLGFPGGGAGVGDDTGGFHTELEQHRSSQRDPVGVAQFGPFHAIRNRTGMGGECPFPACWGYPGQGPTVDQPIRRRGAPYSDGGVCLNESSHSCGRTAPIPAGSGIIPPGGGRRDHRCSQWGGGIQFRDETVSKPSPSANKVGTSLPISSGGRGPSLASLLRCGGDRTRARWGQGVTDGGGTMGEGSSPVRTVAAGSTPSNVVGEECTGVRSRPTACHAFPSSSGKTLSGLRVRGVHGTKVRRGVPPLYRLQSLESVPTNDPFQNGGRSNCGRHAQARGFRDVGGPERCLSNSRSPPQPQEVLSFPQSQRRTTPVEDSKLRSVRSTTDLYQDYETPDGYLETVGDTVSDLYRRPVDRRPVQGTTVPCHGNRNGPPTGRGGIAVKTIKMLFPSTSNVHVSRSDLEHSVHDGVCSAQAIESNGTAGKASSTCCQVFRRYGAHARSGQIGRTDHVYDSGGARSTPEVIIPPTKPRTCGAFGRVEWTNTSQQRGYRCPLMVDDQRTVGTERVGGCPSGARTECQSSHRCGDGNARLGRNSPTRKRRGVQSAGVLHEGRKIPSHKRARITRMLVHHSGPSALGGTSDSMGSGPSILSTRQHGCHKVLQGGGEQITHAVPSRSAVLRLDGIIQPPSIFSAPQRGAERGTGSLVSLGVESHRVEAKSNPLPKSVPAFRSFCRLRLVRQPSESAGRKILQLATRFRKHGVRQSVPCLVDGGDALRVPSAGTSQSDLTKGSPRVRKRLHFDCTDVANTTVVAGNASPPVCISPPPPEPRVGHGGPGGTADLEGTVASMRVLFIRKHAQKIGIAAADLESVWAANKHGYNKAYDPHFERFYAFHKEYHRTPTESGRFSPDSIRAGTLVAFLREQQRQGASLSSLKDASSSVSMAVFEATDGRIHLGKAHVVTRFLKAVRLREPVGPRKQRVQSYSDVARLLEEAWLFGPNDALCLGHLKEKLIILLFVDTAARPSDLAKLFRIMSGRHTQIRFKDNDMELRYFWSKEVDPGSSRTNSSNIFFSKWVRVQGTEPEQIDTVRVMRAFLDRSSDEDLFATTHVPQLRGDFQPVFYGRKRGGLFQAASSDHLSNIAQAAIDRVGMGGMQTTHLRGASTSKIAQLVPAMRDEALKLGRWTTPATFVNHYEAEVVGSWLPVPAKCRSNCQQILRHGFEPRPPSGVSVAEYEAHPTSWVGVSIDGTKVSRFDDGSYWLGSKELSHWEFMERLSRSRTQ